ncbi:MAG: hypothetical protein JW841_05440 [Deltaproteobacteria bacterium]|nr:hypothetical protein [Deltaproteobacteria bacterium]
MQDDITTTPDISRGIIVLILPEVTCTPAPTKNYQVRATTASIGATAASKTVEGQRQSQAEPISVAWERSADASDANYAILPKVTGRQWFDATAVLTGARYYRATMTSPGASGITGASYTGG